MNLKRIYNKYFKYKQPLSQHTHFYFLNASKMMKQNDEQDPSSVSLQQTQQQLSSTHISQQQTGENTSEQQQQTTPTTQQANADTTNAENTNTSETANQKEDGNALFPVDELQRLDEMINRPRWLVPVLPKQELEVLLDASIELCKQGLDTKSEPCQRFFRDGLMVSFTKIFNDDAVTTWKNDIYVRFQIK